jgi:hypothetical protein
MHFCRLFVSLWGEIGPFLWINMVFKLLFLQYYDGERDIR